MPPFVSIFLREDLQKEQDRIGACVACRATCLSPCIRVRKFRAHAEALPLARFSERDTRPVGLLVSIRKGDSERAGSAWDIAMKNGDRIMILRRPQEVTVLGEVQTLTSHLYRPDLARDDYIGLSGGTTQKADKGRIYVVRADGSVVTSGSQWFGRSGVEIRPGDSIVVPLDAERMRPLPLWTAVTQIIYQIAIAADSNMTNLPSTTRVGTLALGLSFR